MDLVSRLGEVLVNNRLSRAKMRFFSKLNQFHNHNSKFSVQDFMQISTLTIRFQINKALSSVKQRHSNPSKQRNKLYRKKSPSTDRMSVIYIRFPLNKVLSLVKFRRPKLNKQSKKRYWKKSSSTDKMPGSSRSLLIIPYQMQLNLR